MNNHNGRDIQDGWVLAVKSGQQFVRAASLLTFVSGLFLIWQPLLRHTHPHLENLIIAPRVQDIANATSLGLGLVLMYMAYELLHRKFVAWFIVLLANVASLANEATFDTATFHYNFLPIVSLIVLIIGRQQFVAHARPQNIRQGIFALIGSVFMALTYGTIGFWILDKHDLGTTFSFANSFVRAVRQCFFIGNGDLMAHTRYGRWFLGSLSAVGISALAYSVFSLLRPLRYEFQTRPIQRKQAQAILEKYGGDTDDHFKLWPEDKSYFFSHDHDAFIAYGVARGVAVCFANPEGRQESIPLLLNDFKLYCIQNGWLIAFMQSSEKYKKTFEECGFHSLLIGADANINLQKFYTETLNNKYFRNINNRFLKGNFSLHRYRSPHPPELIKELKSISDDWMNLSNHHEWNFVTGKFSRSYFDHCDLYVLRDAGQRAIAFVNQLPSYKAGEATIDLMRYRRDVPSNTMDYLFIELMLKLKNDGYKYFNLGMSPLANEDFADNLSTKLLNQIYLVSQRLVSTKGLHQYKSKFNPEWEPRYVYYLGGAALLPQIGLALAKLTIP